MFSAKILIGLLWWIDSTFTLARCHHSTLAFCDFSHCLLLKNILICQVNRCEGSRLREATPARQSSENWTLSVRILRLWPQSKNSQHYSIVLCRMQIPLDASPEPHTFPCSQLLPASLITTSPTPKEKQMADTQEKHTTRVADWNLQNKHLHFHHAVSNWKQAEAGLWPADFLLGSDAVQVHRGGHDLIVVSGTPADALMNHCRSSAPMHRSDGIFRW